MGNYLADRRKALNLTQKEVAERIGVSEGTVSRWEGGQIANMRRDRIAAYADVLKTSTNFIMTGEADPPVKKPLPPGCIPLPEMETIPRLGKIACGEPILAVENWDGTVRAPVELHASFALTCKGWSMIGDRIQDGDTVFIRECPEVENGEIAAVLIGEEATLKHFYYEPGVRVTLKASNPAYSDLVYEGEELNTIRVLGKAVAFLSDIK